MNYQSTNLIAFMYKWRKPLLVFPGAAAVLAIVFSSPWFITPKYESSVIVFPSTTNSVSKALLPQTGFADDDILEFGAEEQAEQLLQILNSDEIFDSVARKFDLMKHYDIDPEGPYKRTELRLTYDENISFERTQFMSIQISVLDRSPDTAAMIANDITDLLDKAKTRILHERAWVGLQIVKGEYQNIKKNMQAMEEDIKALRKKGVHDYETQSAVLSEQLAIAQLEGKSAAAKNLENRLDTLAKYGGKYISLRDELRLTKEEEVKVKTKLDQARVDAEQNLPATFRVNKAYPAEKKTYPVRSLIVLISTFGTFVFTLVVILVLNSLKEVKALEKK